MLSGTAQVTMSNETNRYRILAVVIAMALFVSACGSAEDSATDTVESEQDAGSDQAATSSEDADSSEIETADGAMEDEAMEDDAMSDDAMEEEAMDDADAMSDDSPAPTTTTVPADADQQKRQAEDGFFEGEEEVVEDAEEENNFQDYGVRPFISAERDPLSTFALDVDTASYSIGQEMMRQGQIPPAESVRVEEYLNSFVYDYSAPSDGLAVVAEAGPSPYTDGNTILRLGVQAEQVSNSERPSASLTFVVDTSGSMDRSNRLGLVKTSLERLTLELDSRDTVSIVTYSDNATVLLPPTSVDNRQEILNAIAELQPTGSTNLEAGLQRGYALADDAFQRGGINRVILASDGIANVGLTDPDGLAAQIRDDADRGIHLVTVGVGMGGFNDVLMEQLADQGDGFYRYVNTEQEAQKLFSDDLVSNLLTVAIDGKIQVEFDPRVVEEYRLIGFENRAVLDSDFRNDAVDAGELGAGHQVTALYELRLVPGVDSNDRIGTAQLRWEDPDSGNVTENRLEVTGAVLEDRWVDTSDDYRLAVTVAAFAELLRESPYTGEISLSQVASEAEALSPGSGPIEDLSDFINEVGSRS